jgi:APA family basic amino acid/polyamine antiporter
VAIANDGELDQGFRRVLGPFSATCVVVGAIIGIGIFFTPKAVALSAGSSQMALLAWFCGGVIAVLGALTFAELGSLYSRTAGQYEILRDAYGSFVGFVYVFCNATIIQAGAISVIAYYTALNMGAALMTAGEPSYTWTLIGAVSLIIILTSANVIGVQWGALVQNATVVTKLLTLAVISGLAILLQPRPFEAVAAPTELEPSIGGLLAAITITLFSYGGWQQALWVGGEIKNPRRNVPLAIILGVVVVVASYLLVNWAYLRLLTFEGVVDPGTGALAADAVGQVVPNWGRRVVAMAVAFSGIGVLNAQLLTGPRLICGMARDGRFFGLFARVSPRMGTPVPAVILLGGLGLALLLGMEVSAPILNSVRDSLVAADRSTEISSQTRSGADYIDALTNGVVMVDSVLFLLTGLALLVLRRQFLTASHALRMPLFPLIPLLFGIGEGLVLIGAFMIPKYRDGAYIGLFWIVMAAVVYICFFRVRRQA